MKRKKNGHLLSMTTSTRSSQIDRGCSRGGDDAVAVPHTLPASSWWLVDGITSKSELGPAASTPWGPGKPQPLPPACFWSSPFENELLLPLPSTAAPTAFRACYWAWKSGCSTVASLNFFKNYIQQPTVFHLLASHTLKDFAVKSFL